jgi:hypothetical protein
MLKKSRDDLLWDISNAVNSKLYSPWVSGDQQNYIREIVMAAVYEIVEAVYTEQELETKAEQILLDNNQDRNQN